MNARLMSGDPRAVDANLAAARGKAVGFSYVFLLIVLSVFLQKIAIPGSNGSLPVSLLGLTGASVLGLMTGHLRISTLAFSAYLAFLVIILASYVTSSSPSVSVGSLALLAMVQFPLVLRLAPDTLDYRRLLDLANASFLLVALCGIVQFVGQFVVGTSLTYALDLHLPSALFLENFNRLNPLFYGSNYLKSNGFFLAEPSFFSQYVAIGVIIELMTRRRLSWLLVYALALVFSFSGTGFIMLGVFLPTYVLRRGGPVLLAAILAALVALIAGANAVGLDFFVDRATEFTRQGTSGHARFVSPFLYLGDIVFSDPATMLIGRGPGTITEFFKIFSYEAFDPTWAKIVYEYGLLGTAAYVAFLLAALRAVQPRFLTVPLVVLYGVLGGYAQNAFIVSLLAVFLSWTALQPGMFPISSPRANP